MAGFYAFPPPASLHPWQLSIADIVGEEEVIFKEHLDSIKLHLSDPVNKVLCCFFLVLQSDPPHLVHQSFFRTVAIHGLLMTEDIKYYPFIVDTESESF